MDNSKRFLGPVKMNLSRQHLSIPLVFAKLIRELDDPRLFITFGDRRLLVYPVDAWFDYEQMIHAHRDRQYRKQLHRQKMFGSPPAKLDSSGRIKLSAMHFSILDEPQTVWVVGVKDHLEIFTLSEYERHKKEMQFDPFAAVAEEDMDYVDLPHTSTVE
jgi:DNA-binding transcriptional regulator/RsmH inhibitor MraZ